MAFCSISLRNTFFPLKLIFVCENEVKHKDRINVTSIGRGNRFILLNILFLSQIIRIANYKTEDKFRAFLVLRKSLLGKLLWRKGLIQRFMFLVQI